MCFTCLNVMCRVKRKKCLQSKYAYSGHPVKQVLPGSMLPVYTIKGIRFLSPRFSDGDKSTLVTSNSLISNNRLSRSENLVPVLTQRSTNRQQNIVEKIRSNFQYISNLGVKLKILLKVVVRLVFLSSANLLCRSTDISKCFMESLGFRDHESRLL